MSARAPALRGVLESAVYAEDLAAAEAFYRDVLGLELVAAEPGRHVFFRCGPGMVLVFNPGETEVPPAAGRLPVPTHGARGPGHLCFRVGPSDFAGWIERLGHHGVAIEADVHWPNGARSVYFRDPAGNSLELAEARLWGFADTEGQA